MAPLKVEQYVVGPVQTNCYFAVNDETKEMILIDPGANADRLIQIIEKEKLNPVAILLTHGHFDHIGAANEVREHYGIKIYASCDEEKLLASPARNLSNAYGMSLRVTADVLHNDGDILELAGLKIKAIHTPGHTEGGTCYYIESIGVLFSGDTLFCESVGRTDFPGGSMSDIVHSIKDKLMVLPDDTKVYTGHGEGTSIGYERVHNPFIGA